MTNESYSNNHSQPSPWPTITRIHRLHNGIGEVIPIPGTNSAIRHGMRSDIKTIVYAAHIAAFCFTCQTNEAHPGIPQGMAKPLFGPQTRDYAVYTLVWLNKYYESHRHCAKLAEPKTNMNPQFENPDADPAA